MEKRGKSGGVVVQAGILVAAGFIVKIISLVYRGPLTAIIGDEGNGYYGTAYNFYTIMLIISSYSVPSAISKIMAGKLAVGEYRNAQRVFHCALLYVCVVGTICGLFLYFGAGLLVTSNAVPVLRVFAPVIFLFGLLGVLRGYFQAHGSMVQTSVSQVLEQLIHAVVAIYAAHALMQIVANESGTTQAIYGAVGSALGTGAGVVLALLFMVWMYSINRTVIRSRIRRDRAHRTEPYGEIMRATIMVVTPFILSSFILNLTTTLNQSIYKIMLVDMQGLDQVAVTTQYGIFSQKAVVLTNIPISVATAVASAIIPTISTSFARGDMGETRRRCVNASRMTMIVAVPCAVGMMALARPITMLLFPQQASLGQASLLLAILAVTIIFYSVATVTNAVLQSIGRINRPLISAGVALAIQTAALVLLLKFTTLGIYALAIVSILYSVLIFLCNELFIHRYLRPRIHPVKMYAAPLLAAAVMGLLSWGVYHGVSFLLGLAGLPSAYFVNLIAVLPALAAAVFIYAFLLLRLGAMTESDLRAMPKGAALVRILKKLRWLPEQGKARRGGRRGGNGRAAGRNADDLVDGRGADVLDSGEDEAYGGGARDEGEESPRRGRGALFSGQTRGRGRAYRDDELFSGRGSGTERAEAARPIPAYRRESEDDSYFDEDETES